ncbi:MAG: tRNA-dihydrouridine synthase A [Candidatus Entotheonella factor]|uniref:tRNA-dihydrouridine(20/20a) synthase n=1 Tax=Entotheonella factor TaxID=1429438 RepID=W4LV50_ENTF1|nr:tRNA dihydrouridine(20/20a) synthase DusA [Candidatus Entotheonella palauensis]ETX01959.1 MAG: tRNA-dihydrouridine synthase A [Candidatus Entotheonella factor]
MQYQDNGARHDSSDAVAQRRGEIWPLSVAPMMDRTDRHYRYFMRHITRRTLLYTEMVTTGAILHGDRDKLLSFDPLEKPLALQLGGDDPAQLASCARLAEVWGYDEVNLNVGCPSDRVQNGRFGACMMARPSHVAACVAAMRAATTLPVTVKHRIGIDHLDRYEDLAHFVETVAGARCDRFSVHARIALLNGLSPKENRTIPPLRYDDVYRLKTDFPTLTIEINGGITTLDQTRRHLHEVDGVMIGRAAYDNPYLFATADALFDAQLSLAPTRREVLNGILPYLAQCDAQELPASRTLRHLLGLFAHQPVAKAWKRYLSRHIRPAVQTAGVIREAMTQLPNTILDARPELAVAHLHDTTIEAITG